MRFACPTDPQFVNPAPLQSIPGFGHFHVFARRKPDDEIDVCEGKMESDEDNEDNEDNEDKDDVDEDDADDADDKDCNHSKVPNGGKIPNGHKVPNGNGHKVSNGFPNGHMQGVGQRQPE